MVSLLGIAVLLGIAFALSSKRNINGAPLVAHLLFKHPLARLSVF